MSENHADLVIAFPGICPKEMTLDIKIIFLIVND